MVRLDALGNRIKQVRKEKNLTQTDFAETLSISRSFVSRIESGKETPSDSILKLISMVCDINFEWLKSGNGEKYNKSTSFLLRNQDLLERSGLQGSAALYFAECSGILLKIMSNPYIRDDSEEYYFSQIKSTLFNLDHLLSMDDGCARDWNFYNSITNLINQNIYDALDALKTEGLDSKLVALRVEFTEHH